MQGTFRRMSLHRQKVLQKYSGEYAVVSFNPYSLEWFKKNAPKVKRGQSASFFKDKEITGIRKFSLKRMRLNKKVSEPNFIVYKAEDMPNKYVKKYYGKLPIIACVVRNAEEEEASYNLGVALAKACKEL